MKRGKEGPKHPGPRRTLDELALKRSWFYESIRLVNDQFAALEDAKAVPLAYLKTWARQRCSA